MVYRVNKVETACIDCVGGDSESSSYIVFVRKSETMEAVVVALLASQCYHILQTTDFICVILTGSGIAESMGHLLPRLATHLGKLCSGCALWSFSSSGCKLTVDVSPNTILSALRSIVTGGRSLFVSNLDRDFVRIRGLGMTYDLAMICELERLGLSNNTCYGSAMEGKALLTVKQGHIVGRMLKGVLNILRFRPRTQRQLIAVATVLYDTAQSPDTSARRVTNNLMSAIRGTLDEEVPTLAQHMAAARDDELNDPSITEGLMRMGFAREALSPPPLVGEDPPASVIGRRNVSGSVNRLRPIRSGSLLTSRLGCAAAQIIATSPQQVWGDDAFRQDVSQTES